MKLLAGASVAVLLAGFLIAGGLLVATRGSKSTVCPELRVGVASDIRRLLQTGGPYLQTGGGRCSFFLALEDNDIVAYKTTQPSCTLMLKRDHWECNGATIGASQLEQYPVSIRNVKGFDAVFVDLRPPVTSTT
jgi:hypothetical protein